MVSERATGVIVVQVFWRPAIESAAAVARTLDWRHGDSSDRYTPRPRDGSDLGNLVNCADSRGSMGLRVSNVSPKTFSIAPNARAQPGPGNSAEARALPSRSSPGGRSLARWPDRRGALSRQFEAPGTARPELGVLAIFNPVTNVECDAVASLAR